MKILMLVPLFYPHIGGVEKHLLEISKNLIKNGHIIFIITIKYSEKLKDFERLNNISIIRIPNQNYFKIWIYIFKYRNLLRKCDIIHFHDFNTFYWFAPFILYNSNIFITFHGFEKYPIPKVNIVLRKIAEIFTKGNICVGKFILKYYKTKSTFITYGGINLKESDNNIHKKSKYSHSALFIGRLESDTGILKYIRALRILKEKYNIELHLEICGDGKLRKVIEDYSKKFNLSVNINGFIENLDNYYHQCGFVFCSSYLTILESLYKKKIIISIYQNELKKDYLGQSPFIKFILIAKIPNEIAQYIKKLLNSDEFITEKTIEGYKFSLKNQWSRVSKLYTKLWAHRF